MSVAVSTAAAPTCSTLRPLAESTWACEASTAPSVLTIMPLPAHDEPKASTKRRACVWGGGGGGGGGGTQGHRRKAARHC